MLEWALILSQNLKQADIDGVLMMFWAIWTAKNLKFWGNVVNALPCVTVNKAFHWWQEFLSIAFTTAASKGPLITPKWVRPTFGRLKINVDGAWTMNSKQGGVEIMVRDFDGLCHVAHSRMFTDVFSLTLVEVLTNRAGFELAVERGFHNVIVESDSLQLITALNGSSMDLSPLRLIIEDAKTLLWSIAEVSATYIRRQANNVAHRLTRFGLHSRVDCTWIDDPPIIIWDLLDGEQSFPCTS